MKIAYMGTPDFAAPALQRLIDSRHDVDLVITQPSKPRGRGRKVTDSPVKALADHHGIDVLQPASLKREPIDEEIRRRGIDVIVVAAYGKILPKSLLEAPKIGCINIHASLLPAYRGAAPIQRALMQGELETGVTIMEMVPELDAGPMLAQQRVQIEEDDDALSLTNLLAVLGADMLMGVLDEVERTGKIEGEPQDESLATYAPMIKKDEGWVDWSQPTVDLMFRLRALTPWPGFFTTVRGKRLRIIQAEPMTTEEAELHVEAADAQPGTIIGKMKGFGPIVRTGTGALLLLRVQLEGKAQMTASDFMRGFKLEIGQRLGGAPANVE